MNHDKTRPAAGGWHHWRLSQVSAGFIAVLVGLSSSLVIVYQAAQAAGADEAMLNSWLLALGIGMAVTSIGLSWRYRAPILTAWSTPGAALLATSLVGHHLSDAVGAFIISGLLVTLCGVSGWFERIMNRIPVAIASGLLAGVLINFGMATFVNLGQAPHLILPMIIAYLVAKRLWPRYCMLLVLLVAMVSAVLSGLSLPAMSGPTLAHPLFTAPTFQWSTVLGVAIPLFVVTMASQNLPGVAVIRAAGYQTPISPLITATGITTVILAPLGGFAFNLAAITAAICMNPDADDNAAQRFRAALWAGVFYLLVGIFGAMVTTLFIALPSALVMALAGLALLGTISSSLASAVADPQQREAAVVTCLVTASGMTAAGIGSAFWGLVAGMVMWLVFRVPLKVDRAS